MPRETVYGPSEPRLDEVVPPRPPRDGAESLEIKFRVAQVMAAERRRRASEHEGEGGPAEDQGPEAGGVDSGPLPDGELEEVWKRLEAAEERIAVVEHRAETAEERARLAEHRVEAIESRALETIQRLEKALGGRRAQDPERAAASEVRVAGRRFARKGRFEEGDPSEPAESPSE